MLSLYFIGTEDELSDYFGNTQGLCGNFNGDASEKDEFFNRNNGFSAQTALEFGNSHQQGKN